MKQTGGSDDQKRRAAESAAARVEDGMTVGLGTGSTAAHAIRELGERVDAGLDVVGVATSFAAGELARDVGVPLADVADVDGVDVAIDGADQVVPTDAGGFDDGGPSDDRAFVLVKGGGAAHAREKLVDATADAFHVVADPSKLADAVSCPIPIEVLPAARTTVADAVVDLGGDPELGRRRTRPLRRPRRRRPRRHRRRRHRPSSHRLTPALHDVTSLTTPEMPLRDVTLPAVGSRRCRCGK